MNFWKPFISLMTTKVNFHIFFGDLIQFGLSIMLFTENSILSDDLNLRRSSVHVNK